MKLFITGGNGFLGKHVLKELGNTNYLAPKSSELDILNFNQLTDYLSYHKPNIILHMAAICGGIGANKNSPADFLRDNTQMALNIYEAARKYNVKRVYSLGSVCAYPKYCPIPFREDDIWNGAAEETNFPYGQSKRTLMMLGQTYREQYGIVGAHLIPVNLYGEHDHFDLINSHIIPALIKKFDDAIINNSSIVECWGTGTPTREFLYVRDAAQAIVKTINNNIDIELPINLGVGKDISIYDISYLIKDLMRYDGAIVFNKNSSFDGQPKRMLDVSRAKKFLNWAATTPLEEGLTRTINWYRQQVAS